MAQYNSKEEYYLAQGEKQRKAFLENIGTYKTVEDLYADLGKLIEQGHGKKVVSVNDNCGGGYMLNKTDTIEVLGDICEIG